ncbi:LysR family transcriptional regulator [Intrasporangium calvum]|uniref:LysR family transcriptional regulator n=1 Tax=Intrasporangium calvum TaxID=53358 RepID=A0ABT5GL38_9MICO|nr:LysR family transcriptional regulator [Intrasporangium calvum]MDC5698882.1 LysR family transcriptional regulator [Intrasporangium calvum]
MRLQYVQAFITLAEELNFRSAAARLCLSQPALTAQIHELERVLAVTLFERNRHGTQLTAAGAMLLPLAETAAAAWGDLIGAAAGAGVAGGRARCRFRVGLVVGGIGPPTWPTLERFQWTRPEIELVVRQLGFHNALDALADDLVDALLLHGPTDDRHAQVVTVGFTRVGVLVGRRSPWAHNETLDEEDIVPLLRYAPPAEMGREFRELWMPERALQPRRATKDLPGHGGISAMIRATALGGAVGFWPAHLTVPASSGTLVRPLEQERWAPLQVAVRRLGTEAEDLVEAARRVIAEHPGRRLADHGV